MTGFTRNAKVPDKIVDERIALREPDKKLRTYIHVQHTHTHSAQGTSAWNTATRSAKASAGNQANLSTITIAHTTNASQISRRTRIIIVKHGSNQLFTADMHQIIKTHGLLTG